MSEPKPELRRVIIDTPVEALPELLTTIGKFATERTMVADMLANSADAHETLVSFRRAEVTYNPAMVSWAYDDQRKASVPIITGANFEDFARRHGYIENAGMQVIRPLLRAAKDPGLHNTETYLFKKNGHPQAILADRFPALVHDLERRRIEPKGVGGSRIKFLEHCLEDLYVLRGSSK